MASVFEDLWGNVSAAKVAYSILLLAAICLLSRELIRVWWDPQLYVGSFKYFNNGQPDAGRAENFGASLLAQHSSLRAELEAEHHRRAEAKDRPEEVLHTWPVAGGTISLPPDLKALELKINGFDIGGLLATLRGWISQPNEVLVTVQTRTFKGGGKEVELVDTDVAWPRAPKLEKNKPASLQHFRSWGSKGDDEAAALLAASLIWADAAKQNADLLNVGRQNFSDWAYAWLQYRVVGYEGATPGDLDDTQKVRLAAAGARITPLLRDNGAYPEVWRLAADLVTLHPDSIPGGDANAYRRSYLKALGLEEKGVAPTVIAEAAEAAAARVPEIQAGALLWNRQSAVRFSAVVKDESGKQFLLLPDLITNNAPLPLTVYADMSGQQAVAQITRRISNDGVDLALAEPVPGLSVSNGAIKEAGPVPDIGETVKLLPGDKRAKIVAVGARLPPIAGGLIEVIPKITGPGDAGAPVLDLAGKLVAMGYAGSDKASYLVALDNLLEREKLTVVVGPHGP